VSILPLSLAKANSSLYQSIIYIYYNGLSILTNDLGTLLVLLYNTPQYGNFYELGLSIDTC